MSETREQSPLPPPPSPAHNDSQGVILFLKVIMLAVFIWPLAQYSITMKEDAEVISVTSNETTKEIQTITRVVPKPPPACPKSYMLVILEEICLELALKKDTQCTPEDYHNLSKHKLPKMAKNNTTGEPRGTIVGYFAAGLLLASLGAALIELYKAKSQTPKKNKTPLSRKCSLADLTVLKHHRKELVRRESILELPEDGAGGHKQLGLKPAPLHRRCSFPVGPSTYGFLPQHNSYSMESSRRISIVDSRRPSFLDVNRRQSAVDSRRLSVVDGRRLSGDCRVIQLDGRRVSVSESDALERRHWSKLVHRH